ncbi:MAG TPA: LysR family transcriptional regulator [Albitalea sp.]|nr:LysR family transcriptional regulator [Albitalea sp.]
MDLPALDAFVKVVQAGSFTRAADVLGTQKARLSRVVSALEIELGARLLERTTRSLRLTEIGRAVFERAQGILSASEDLVQFTRALQAQPQGTLKLTCGTDFGQVMANGWIAGYLKRYPAVTAEVEYTSRIVDLVHEGYDLGLRVGTLEESRLAVRRLGELHYGLFASPAYLAQRGAPKGIAELSAHTLLMFTTGSHRSGWQVSRGSESQRINGSGALRTNSSQMIRDACEAGLGIARLPLPMARDALRAERLVPLLTDWQHAPVPVHAVFPSNRYLAPKVRAFIDHAIEAFTPQ